MEYAVEIAKTVFEQMGGKGFAMMVGMKNPYLYSHNDYNDNVKVTFFFSAKAKNNANFVSVTYVRAMDTYNVEFGRKGRKDVETLASFEDVYADQLQSIFRDVTGLEPGFPRIFIME